MNKNKNVRTSVLVYDTHTPVLPQRVESITTRVLRKMKKSNVNVRHCEEQWAGLSQSPSGAENTGEIA